MSKPKIIVPCAGYGTRMGMKPHQAKEMLIHKDENGPIIDYIIDIGKTLNLDILCITRKEKKELNEYLTTKNVEIMYHEPQGEWMDTVYDSMSKWSTLNILMLPDTRWSPKYKAVDEILWRMTNFNVPAVFAAHKVDDPQNWGVLSKYFLIEKPKETNSNLAFGLIGFKNYDGRQIFDNLRKFKFVNYPLDSQFILLDKFEDITRPKGKLNWEK